MTISYRYPWQEALANAVTDPAELLQILELDSSLLPAANRAAQLFNLRVPRGFIRRMQKNNSQDPLLQQVLPLQAELIATLGYTSDPLQERSANPLPGLLHKYKGRVLLTLAGSCSINCRYCFRRSFPYTENNPGRTGWEKVIDYIAEDHSITEVIFSGGDPLIVPDQSLQYISNKLAQLSHIKTLRIHTRIPIVLPERLTSPFIDWLAAFPLRKVIVLHSNHPQEFNDEVYVGLKLLRQANVTLLNQAVLLKGINDDINTLVALSETLFSAGVLPYYLHLLDKTQGTAHFEVNLANAQRLIKQMRETLPGYLVPRLVREIAGEKSKTLIENSVLA